MEGCVYKSTGSWYVVKDTNNAFWNCRIKGKFRMQGIKSTNPITVGDQVAFEEDEVEHQGIITEIKDRKNAIIRKSINLSKRTHLIAANIDLCFLFVTLTDPPTSLGFIDRFLVSAKAFDVPVHIVINKTDLYKSEELKALHHQYQSTYERVGYPVSSVSIDAKEGVNELKALAANKTVVISGHSGTGKSSFIQELAPNLNIKVGSTSDVHKKGKHTTTFAEMFDLPGNIKLIDTPGIKGFGVVEVEKEELAHFFPEMIALLTDCKFYNCQHLNEPGCAVKKAVENNEIATSRYKSYKMIQTDDEEGSFRKDIYK